MRVEYNFAKKTTWRDHIDISRYTGMEVEHGLNTANKYAMGSAANLGHYDPTSFRQSTTGSFQEKVDKKYAGVKSRAFS
tara:strand:- start:77 stop:313 length:237 start_codon:yes stop_codon:yes gene_type:complete